MSSCGTERVEPGRFREPAIDPFEADSADHATRGLLTRAIRQTDECYSAAVSPAQWLVASGAPELGMSEETRLMPGSGQLADPTRRHDLREATGPDRMQRPMSDRPDRWDADEVAGRASRSLSLAGGSVATRRSHPPPLIHHVLCFLAARHALQDIMCQPYYLGSSASYQLREG